MALELRKWQSYGLGEPSRTFDPYVRNLACGILRQTLRDLVLPHKSPGAQRKWQGDATQWIFSDDQSPGSYWWVCAIVGIDTSVIRHWLNAYKETNAQSKEKEARSWPICSWNTVIRNPPKIPNHRMIPYSRLHRSN